MNEKFYDFKNRMTKEKNVKIQLILVSAVTNKVAY